MAPPDRFFWRLAFLVFAVLAVLTYFPVLTGKVPLPAQIVMRLPPWSQLLQPAVAPIAELGDLIAFVYPMRSFAARSIRSGVLPLWNPELLSGAPFLASAQSALFYPLNVFSYILP